MFLTDSGQIWTDLFFSPFRKFYLWKILPLILHTNTFTLAKEHKKSKKDKKSKSLSSSCKTGKLSQNIDKSNLF
jgi:hypothetical protein